MSSGDSSRRKITLRGVAPPANRNSARPPAPLPSRVRDQNPPALREAQRATLPWRQDGARSRAHDSDENGVVIRLHGFRNQREGLASWQPSPIPFDPSLPEDVFRNKPSPPKPACSKQPLSRDAGLPKPGSILDKYRLEEVLGVGGFAAVYRATHLLLHVPVAIKLLRPKVIERCPSAIELLCNEARYAARIDHPNVVRVHDVTHNAQITYVVMEYVAGPSLERLLQTEGRLLLARVLRIGLDVLAGLRAGLERGLVHRDIKPANILMTPQGSAKIADLGLAQSTRLDPVEENAEDRQRIVGTRGYMAPEQIEGRVRVDFRADIYALGVTLYYAALGVPPFTDSRVAARHERGSQVGLPRDAEMLFVRMMAPDPARRPESYTALEHELTKLCALYP